MLYKSLILLKADRPHPRDYLTHTQTPWTDNDSSLLFAALGKADPLVLSWVTAINASMES